MTDILCFEKNTATMRQDVSGTPYAPLITEELTDVDIITGSSFPNSGKYATLELNRWKLDGSYSLVEDDTKIAYWGNVISNESGECDRRGRIVIYFNTPQTIEVISGVTIIFTDRESACSDYTIGVGYAGRSIWRENNVVNNSAIASKNFRTIDELQGKQFDFIRIVFNKTIKPQRSIKISDIKLGYCYHLPEDKFYNLSVLENISIPSDTIPINTMSFTVNATKEEVDNLIYYKYMELYRDSSQFGGYYLDDTPKTTNNKYTIRAQDAIGILDNKDYNDTLFISLDDEPITIKSVLDSIFEGTDIPYITDNDFENSQISIQLTALTRRAALAQILFLTNSVCKKLRNGTLWIGKLDTSVINGDMTDNLFGDCSVSESTPVSTISMQKIDLAEGDALPSDDWNIELVGSNKDDATIVMTLPDIPWTPTLQTTMYYLISLKDQYGEFAIECGLASAELYVFTSAKYLQDNVRFSNRQIFFTIDKHAIDSERNKYGEYPTYYEVINGKTFVYRGHTGTQWSGLTGRINNADFTTIKVYKLHNTVETANSVSLAPSSQFSETANANIFNTIKTQTLQVQTIQASKVVIDGVTELGEEIETVDIPVTDNAGEPTGKTETVTTVTPVNNILPTLMNRYYQYNKELSGTILTDNKECGDTVSLILPDIGKVTGTITQLEYKLINKLIAKAKIWLYYMEGAE